MLASLWTYLGLLLAASAGQAAEAPALSADQIVSRYVTARGGSERWSEVQTLRFEGRMTLSDDVVVPFTLEMKRPRKTRFEFVFEGTTAVQAFDGEKGWTLRPFAGRDEPEDMSPAELSAAVGQSEFGGPLLDYRSKGHGVRLLGEVEANGRRAHELEMTLATGSVRHVFIDATDYTEVMATSSRLLAGRQREVVTHFSDYRWVDGVLLPFVLETFTSTNPNKRRLKVDRVEVNPPLDDARFAKPEPPDGGGRE